MYLLNLTFLHNLHCDYPGDIRKSLMAGLVHVLFSSCDVEPCPILNLPLNANSPPQSLRIRSLPAIPLPVDQGPPSPK